MINYFTKHIIQLFIISIVAISCRLKPQVIELKPTFIKSSELISLGKNIRVTTLDSRPIPQIIGIRYENPSNIFTKQFFQQLTTLTEIPYINNYENIGEKINIIAEEYLVSQGFTLGSGKNLEITLESLKYDAIKKLKWYEMPRTKIRIYFTTKLQNEEGETMYKGQHEYAIEHVYPIFQPRSKTNEKNINYALSEGIRRIFDDQNLHEALKK